MLWSSRRAFRQAAKSIVAALEFLNSPKSPTTDFPEPPSLQDVYDMTMYLRCHFRSEGHFVGWVPMDEGADCFPDLQEIYKKAKLVFPDAMYSNHILPTRGQLFAPRAHLLAMYSGKKSIVDSIVSTYSYGTLFAYASTSQTTIPSKGITLIL